MASIAVLMTCYNRRNTTLACLGSLFRQESPEKVCLTVYLVDDGSTDGTGEAVTKQYPEVRVIRGRGNLYWCGGMRMAWAEAMKQDYDYYLWLNDDTALLSDALLTLLDAAYARDKCSDDSSGIIVGSTFHPETGAHTYGGYLQPKRNSLDFRAVIPAGSIQPCDTFNGNCVLVPRDIAQKLGNISPEFSHAIGDTDYGLRAKQKNIPMWVAPEYVGECGSNRSPSWQDNALPLRERIRRLKSPKGLPPKEWMIFCKRHTGWRWPMKTVKLYMRVFCPSAWEAMKKIFK